MAFFFKKKKKKQYEGEDRKLIDSYNDKNFAVHPKMRAEEITEELISNYMCTKNIPDPELLIRTSGEYRISNFLLWQIAYSELYFTDVLWPDFQKEDLYKAIVNYQSRERRFGKTSEQINK